MKKVCTKVQERLAAPQGEDAMTVLRREATLLPAGGHCGRWSELSGAVPRTETNYKPATIFLQNHEHQIVCGESP
jgi:hypothetical protein